MDNKIFELAVEYYLRVNLPKCIPHLDNEGRVLSTDSKPLKPADPIPYISDDGFLFLYDGRNLLKKACKDMLTSKNGKLSKTAKVETLDDLLQVIDREGGNKSDLTWVYNHESGEIASTHTSLKNYYEGVEEMVLKQKGLPRNFLSSDGSVSKYDTGKRTSVALVTTARYNVGAVVIKTSEYGIGGKVVHFKEGRLVEEVFARYNKDKDLIELVHRTYKPGAKGVIRDTEKISPYFSLLTMPYGSEMNRRAA